MKPLHLSYVNPGNYHSVRLNRIQIHSSDLSVKRKPRTIYNTTLSILSKAYFRQKIIIMTLTDRLRTSISLAAISRACYNLNDDQIQFSLGLAALELASCERKVYEG
jgi:hypothetical protein